MNRLVKHTTCLQDVVRRSGGLKPALMKCWRLYRRAGLAGVGARLTALHRQSIDYMTWISRYDTLTVEARARIQERVHAFLYQPLISVVMPTYNTKSDWLE